MRFPTVLKKGCHFILWVICACSHRDELPGIGGPYKPKKSTTRPAVLEVVPTVFNFGKQAIGSYHNLTLTLSHVEGELSASNISLTPPTEPYGYKSDMPFPGLGGDCSPSGLNVGSSCRINLFYYPSNTSASGSSLALRYFDGTIERALPIELSGTGDSTPTLTISISSDPRDAEDKSYDFGSAPFGSAPKDIVLYVHYAGVRPATGVAMPQLVDPFSFVSTNCSAIMDSQTPSPCQFIVRYDPSVAIGNHSQQLEITYNDGGTGLHARYMVKGNTTPDSALLVFQDSGGPPLVANTLRFPIQLAGSGSSSKSVRVKNVGGLVATMIAPGDPSFTGASVFSYLGNSGYPGTGGNCGASLDPGAYCTLYLNFVPAEILNYNGQLHQTYLNGRGETVGSSLNMTGRGGRPATLTLNSPWDSSTETTFGKVPLNYPKSLPFTLQNCSDCVAATSVTIAANDALQAPFERTLSCTQVAAENGQCTFRIRFTPSVDQLYSDLYDIRYFDGLGFQNMDPQPGVSGLGDRGAYLEFCNSADFQFGSIPIGSPKSSSTYFPPVEICYYGAEPATVQSVSVLGSGFSFPTGAFPGGGTCGNPTIQPTGTPAKCTVVVEFNPTVEGFYSTPLSITYLNGLGSTLTVIRTLRGRGVQPVTLSLAGSFYYTPINPDPIPARVVTFKNALGSADVSSIISFIDFGTGEDPFRLAQDNCTGLTLSPGATCTLTIEYQPSFPGLSSNQTVLKVSYVVGGNSLQVPLQLVGSAVVPLKVSTNGSHTCVREPFGQVRCWGRNNFGQLGIESTNNIGDGPSEMGPNLRDTRLGTNIYATDIALGFFHTCAILNTGQIKCWGFNQEGQLGIGSTALAIGDQINEMGGSLPTVSLGNDSVTKITAGYEHTCALLSNGQVKCWGANHSGQLGLGDTLSRGRDLNQMGNNLPAVPLGQSAVAISANAGHTCALLVDGSVKCWGDGFYAQLGQGNRQTIGDEPSEMQQLSSIALGSNWVARSVRAGGGFTCVMVESTLDSHRALKCFGQQKAGVGNLGMPKWCKDINEVAGPCSDQYPYPRDAYGIFPTEMGDGLIEISVGGVLRELSSGSSHSCVLLDNGAVKCWGENSLGQLGLGHTQNLGEGANDMGSNLAVLNLGLIPIREMAVGDNHTCAIRTDESLVCWGSNQYGEMGRGLACVGNHCALGDQPGEIPPIVVQYK